MNKDTCLDVVILFLTLFVIIGMFMGFVALINWMLS